MESYISSHKNYSIEVVYYFDEDLGFCPVKKYLDGYRKLKNKSQKIKRGVKILIDIDSKIRHIRDMDGKAVPPMAKPIHQDNLFEIGKSKDENTTIRILCCCCKGKMVLLHAFEKSTHYTTNLKKNLVEKNYKIASEYCKKFKLNPKNYEKYPEEKIE